MEEAMIFAAMAFVSAPAQAGSPALVIQDRQEVAQQIGERELLERDLAYELAPVKSHDDLESMLAKGIEGTPLTALSPGARERFLQSLVFTENGLGAFYYAALRSDELIVTPQADGGDHVGYLCLDRGTCMESRSFICTGNC